MLERLTAWLRRRGGTNGESDAEIARRPALVTWARPGSSRLFFVFQGKRLQLMMEPLAFFRETGLLSTNIVMLGDDRRCFYHAGVSDDLPDVAAIRERLAAEQRALPHVRATYTLGSSAGGYAAILFGYYLQVDTVHAFAPQTLLDMKRLSGQTGRDDAWRFPAPHKDLALLLTAGNGRTRYRVYYSEGNAEDRAFAERIAGCPGVELFPQPGDSHVVVQEMQRRGLLRDLLAAGDA